MKKIYDTIIIGGGPAGYSAALYASRAGLETLLIEKMSPGGQMALTDTIDNYPGYENGIDGFTLGMKMADGAHRFGTVTEYGEVKEVFLEGEVKKIVGDFGEKLAKTVIIATGADPRELGLPMERELIGRGVHYCAHCDGRFYKDKTVVVVGGGNSAAADALYLARIAKKVYVVHRRDTLRATKIYHEPLMKEENVEFLWNSTLTDIHYDEKVKAAVVTGTDLSESIIPVDGIFISIGRKPSTAFLPVELLDSAGYIIAGESTESAIAGVFAAGDVRTKSLRQVVTAVADGAIAADAVEKYLIAEAGRKSSAIV